MYTSIEDFDQEVKRQFGLWSGSYKTQIFDRDFDTYVDIEDITTELMDKAIIKIVTHNAEAPALLGSVGDVIRTASEIPPIAVPVPLEVIEENASSVGEKKSKPWVTPYKLPYSAIPKDIIDRLDRGLQLGQNHRSMLWLPLFEDVRQFTILPKPRQYREVIEALFKRWPYLSPQGYESSAMDSYKEMFRVFFANHRRRHYRHVPEVKASIDKVRYNLVTVLLHIEWGVGCGVGGLFT